MNRQDIIDKMTPSEKEVFEKYKDTYPFPIRKFIEEIGVNITKENKIPARILNKLDKYTKNYLLCAQLIYKITGYKPKNKYELDRSDMIASEFLMPVEVFVKVCKDLTSEYTPEQFVLELIKYFEVPFEIIDKYFDYAQEQIIIRHKDKITFN